MKANFSYVAVLGALMISTAQAQTNLPLSSSTQIVLVTTKDWDAVQGKMQCFQRVNPDAQWKPVGKSIPVVVGRNGLGWGIGIHPQTTLSGPMKHEGDGKSPAGIFRLSLAFGIAPTNEMKSIKMPYLQLTDGVECVDDVKSTHYNSIVDRAQTAKPDWDSSEKMHESRNAYRLGIVVDHNTAHEPGAGSCVFMHIWDNDHTGTAGCTAMTPSEMEKLLRWLDPAARPVLVQLPVEDYNTLKKSWQLP